MLEKVERVTTDKVVAERLKQWIIENDLQPEDRLPTEQQLSEEKDHGGDLVCLNWVL